VARAILCSEEELSPRLLIMRTSFGPLPQNANPYERNNLWQLSTALAWGPRKCEPGLPLESKGGDGPWWNQAICTTRSTNDPVWSTCWIRQAL